MKVGGPEMAPYNPQRSERPGQAVALLDPRGVRGATSVPTHVIS